MAYNSTVNALLPTPSQNRLQHGACDSVGFERLQNVLCRMPFVDKERYGGHADLLAFSFVCPV